jgi:hypothetical protein
VKGGCSSVVLITAGAPENSQKTCSPGNPASGGNPVLRRSWVGAIFKTIFMKTIQKSKIKPIRKVKFKLCIYTMKLSAGLPNLMRRSF